jgi:hypothetical protein
MNIENISTCPQKDPKNIILNDLETLISQNLPPEGVLVMIATHGHLPSYHCFRDYVLGQSDFLAFVHFLVYIKYTFDEHELLNNY